MSEGPGSTANESVGSWIQRLAQPFPDPGGGAAASVVVAAGAALLAMSAGYAEPGPTRTAAERAAADVRRRALDAADEDAAHSAALAEAYHLPEHDPRRDALLRDRMLAAAASSRDVGELPRALLPALTEVADRVPPLLAADVAVAAGLLAAAVRASAVNLRSNISSARAAGASGADLMPLEDAGRRLQRLAETFDTTASAAMGRL
jgi:formiminotetrahydrofolate cyclodeaminase